ncbi:DUF3379 domain-containing protein [Vibrio hannami]|uniref:DUF3379 domain-containing protein n=1 Tax=Vibrio hannami TaxID=2717094 RepID=UPI00240F05F5|nr:DUF3379 domain-containing protein [Vibrio hannami]MDG3088739.1 DUF3379 domain-containing protein [Vibrio hannami]
MDDLEFRRRILSEPKFRDKELLSAIENSEANARFADDVFKLDAKLEDAFKVDVPDDLADRILFNQTSEPVKSSFTKRALAIAATVAFTAGVLIGQVNWSPLLVSPAYASLADTAIEHVEHESPFTDRLDEQVTSKQVNMKLAPFSYQFTEEFPYHVYYLNHCGFGASNALHMVFEGEKGRITLFVTNIGSEKEIDFNKDGMSGVVIPVKDSSMILVGSEGEDIQKIASTLTPIIQPMH